MDDLLRRARLKAEPVEIGTWAEAPDAIEVSLGGEVIYTAAVVEDPEAEATALLGAFRRVFEAGVAVGLEMARSKSDG